MSTHPFSPTPYPEVNTVLHLLLSNVQTVLAQRFVGLYLYGSLSSGDFSLQRSDIDFLVVTAGELPAELISALEAMHTRIAASGLKWAAKLEGAYTPQSDLRRYDPNHAPRPGVNEGHFYLVREESDWIIQRYVLREYGLVVAGPPLQPWIDPVHPDDLRQAVRGILQEWWAPMLQAPARLQDREYQAYAILTMCRALYTLQHGVLLSKPASARWAQETLGERYATLIEQALAWPDGPQPGSLEETLTLIQYTLEQIQPPPIQD